MGAIKAHFDILTVIRQVMAAEIDIALICHKGPDIEAGWNEILALIRQSQAMRRKSRESVERILALKKRFLAPA